MRKYPAIIISSLVFITLVTAFTLTIYPANSASSSTSDIPNIVDELYLGLPAGNGHAPQRIALDRERRRLYTLNNGLAELNEGNTISVIDLNSNQVIALIQLGTLPPASPLQPTPTPPSALDLQLDPYRPRLYALTGDPYSDPPFNRLSIIDLNTFTVVDTLTGVVAVAPGPDHLYLASPTRLWAADPVSLTEITFSNLPAPISNPPPFLLLNTSANRLYLGQRQSGLLTIFAADSLVPIGSSAGAGQLVEAVVDEASQQIWVINSDATQLTLRALNRDGQPVTTPAPFILTDDTFSQPHLALTGASLAVVNRTIDSALLQIFDKSNLTLSTSLTIPSHPYDLAADSATGRLYAAYSDTTSYILAVDPVSGAGESIFTALLINDAVADPQAGRLYVLDNERILRALSLTDYIEVARLNLKPELNCHDAAGCLLPDRNVQPALALDPTRQRLYLSGNPAQVINTTSFSVAATLDTPGQLTPDPTSDRLYLTPPCQCRIEQCNTLVLSANTLTGATSLFPPQDPLTAPCVIGATLDPQNQYLYALIFNGVAGSNSGNTFSTFDVSGPPQLIYNASQISYYDTFAFDPERQRAFISMSRFDRSFIQRFEAQGQTISLTLELAGADGLLLYNPPLDRLYAVNGRALQVFDGDLTLLSEITLPGLFKPLAFDPQAQRLYLGGPNANLLIVATGGGQFTSPPQPLAAQQSLTPPQLFISPSGHYFRVANGQLYRAEGPDWVVLGQGLPDRPITALAISPNYAADRILLAGLAGQGRNGGLYRSTDGGHTWQPITRGLTDLEISQIAFSPTFAQDKTIFLTTLYRGLFRSTDGGDTWQGLAGRYAGEPGEAQLSQLAVSPTFAQEKLVIISGSSLLRSTDGGDTWSDTGLPPGKVAFSPDFARDRLILSEGRWRSTDAGLTWQPAAAGLEPNQGVQNLFFSPNFAVDQTVYLLLYQDFDQPLKLQRSVDAGRIWQSVMAGLPANFGLATATILPSGELYLSDKAGQQPFVIAPQSLTWGQPALELNQLDLQAMALAPDDAIFVANSIAGVLKSTDQGRTWIDTNFPARADETKPAHLAVANNGALFAATGTIIERSSNGGQSWTYLSKLPAGFEVTALAVSPTFAPDGIVLVGGNYATRQLLRSPDGGQSWRIVFDGSTVDGASDIGAIVFSPNFASDKTAYAWLQYGGLLRSTDSGQSWSRISSTINDAFVQSLTLSPDGLRLYLGTLYGGLYVSEDGGQSWLDLSANIPDERTWSSALAFGPNNSLLLGTDIGVYRSLDGGQSWTRASDSLPVDPDQGTPQSVRALAFRGERLYAALTRGGLYISDNQGQSWRSAE